MTRAMTFAQLAQLPAVVDLTTAAAVLRIGRSTAYRLAANDAFPIPLIKAGRSYRVVTSALIDVLGATEVVAELANIGGDCDANADTSDS